MPLIISHTIAVLVFLSGVINIVSALFSRIPPHSYFLEELFPIGVIHISRTLVIIAGVFLLFLAQGLWARKERSWWLSFIVISFSIVLHLIKRLDYRESVILLVILANLVVFKKIFTVKSSRYGIFKGIRLSLEILLILFGYSFFGYYALQGQFTNPVNFQNIVRDYTFTIFGVGKDTFIPLTRHAAWFEDSISTVGLFSLIFIYAALFSPLIEKGKPTEDELELAKKIIKGSGSNSLDYFNLMPDKKLFFNTARTGFLSYKISYDTAVVLSDPEGLNPENTLNEFTRSMDGRGLKFAFYGSTEKYTGLYGNEKLKLMKIGEEAVLRTEAFDINKPDLKDIRYGMNRIEKFGYRLTLYPMDQIPWKVINDTDGLYKNWLSAKDTPPLGFSLGYYPLPPISDAYLLAVYTADAKLMSVFSFFPSLSGRCMTLDLMLRNPETPNGIVEGAIGRSVSIFKEMGIEEVNLGMAPVQGTDDQSLNNRTLNYIFNFVSKFSGYQNLHKFKENFDPVWRNKYLVYKNAADLPRVSLAIARVHLPEKIKIKLPKFKIRKRKI